MRGNEIVEDILIVTAVFFLIPIVFVLVLVFGIALLYTWPLILWTFVIMFLLWQKKRSKNEIHKGKIKLIKVPDWVKKATIVIISIPISILILVLGVLGLLWLPPKLAAITITVVITFLIFKDE